MNQIRRLDEKDVDMTRDNLKASSGKTGCIPVLAIFMLMMAGCSHIHSKPSKTTRARYDAFIPPAAMRITTRSNQLMVVGLPITQAPPVYPSNMVDKDVPLGKVCLAIAIDRKGEVYSNHPLYGMLDCPDSARTVEPAFLEAAQSAVMQWRFEPSFVCTFPEGSDASKKSAYCKLEGGTVRKVPVMLAFEFTYSQTGGSSRVRVGRIHP